MARLLVVLLGLTIGFVAPAASSAVGVPSASQSIVDDVVVGDASGDPILARNNGCILVPAGFDVDVRDILGTPLQGTTVVLDFSAASVRLIAVQNPGTTINCTLRQISKITDGQGKVSFGPRFGRADNVNNVRVYADGVLLKMVPARSTDIDGLDGTTGLNDFQLFAANFNTGSFDPSTNFDNCVSGMVVTGLPDFAIFTAQYLTSASGPYCP